MLNEISSSNKIFAYYRAIRKSLRDFRPLWYSSRDGHTEGEHVNRGRDTQSFCPTLQVLDMSTLSDTASSPRVDISSTCKVGQKLGVSLPMLTCSPAAWPSRLLCRRGRKSRRDLWITLYCLEEMSLFVLRLITALKQTTSWSAFECQNVRRWLKQVV